MTEQTGDPAQAMRPFDRSRATALCWAKGRRFSFWRSFPTRWRAGRVFTPKSPGTDEVARPITPPTRIPEGFGYARALEKALRNARVNPDEVDYINAHGSATPLE